MRQGHRWVVDLAVSLQVGFVTMRALAILLFLAGLPAFAQDAAPSIVPPALSKFIEAPFPEAEKAPGRSASVVLQLSIDEKGAVTLATVLTPAVSTSFDEAAVKAAQQFVFSPATRGGVPLAVKMSYRYDFVWKQEMVMVQKSTADFAGRVRDGSSKAPLAGALVKLDSGQTATTDADGRFSISDVTPGDHQVSVKLKALPGVKTREKFEAGKKVDATYELTTEKPKKASSEDDEIVVTAPRITRQVLVTEVKTEQARKVPGTQGDVLKVVENLPGVARAAAGSGQLVVWGAAPEDTRVYLGGVRLPRLYHDGGFRSVIHSDLVRSVELIPGGYGPTYGRGLGGLVTIQLRPLDEPGFHGSVSAGIVDTSISMRARLIDSLSVAVAFRKSVLRPLLNAVTTTPIDDIVPIPDFSDGQIRLAWRPTSKDTVELGGLLSTDQIARALVRPDPALTRRETSDSRFWRIYGRYEHKEGAAVVTLVPSFGLDSDAKVNSFGTLNIDSSTRAWRWGLRGSWSGAVQSWLHAEVGFDGEGAATSMRRAGSVAYPSREGDVRVFGQAPSDQINSDTWSVTTVSIAAYAEGDVSLLKGALHLVPGLRVDPFVVEGSRATPVVGDTPSIGYAKQTVLIEPRLSARYAPTAWLSFRGAAGIYRQPAVEADLSAVFGSPSLSFSEARHALAGVQVKPFSWVDVELTGFLTTSSGLSARSKLESPLLAQALVSTGEGRSMGGQLLVRVNPSSRVFGWLSYSLIRSERRAGPAAEWRLFDYDQTHVLTALASVKLGYGFEVSARVRISSGYPRTPVISAWFDARTNTFQPVLGAQNSIRIAPFFALDVRGSKTFKFDKTELEIFLDVQNATNQRNPEELVYNSSYTQQSTISGLPILPVLGGRFSW